MGLMDKVLRLVWPKGRAHVLAGDGSSLITALGLVFDDARTTVRSIIGESRPGEAAETLAEWHEALGLEYDETRPVDEQRDRLEAVRYSLGGSTLNILYRQVAKEFPDIVISEVPAMGECGVAECGVAYCGGLECDYSPTLYDVSGTLLDEYQEARLDAILDHYAPLHLIPSTYGVVVLTLTISAETGLATCGLAECGAT